MWKFVTNYAVNVMNFQPELLEVDLKTEQTSWTAFGVTGHFDLKEDMNQDYKVRFEYFMSALLSVFLS